MGCACSRRGLRTFWHARRSSRQSRELLGICRSNRELSAGASACAEHPVANAGRDLQALKQRLIHSELRAIEAKCEAAAAAAVEAEREAALKPQRARLYTSDSHCPSFCGSDGACCRLDAGLLAYGFGGIGCASSLLHARAPRRRSRTRLQPSTRT